MIKGSAGHTGGQDLFIEVKRLNGLVKGTKHYESRNMTRGVVLLITNYITLHSATPIISVIYAGVPVLT